MQVFLFLFFSHNIKFSFKAFEDEGMFGGGMLLRKLPGAEGTLASYLS
jgi:hypothetical protein